MRRRGILLTTYGMVQRNGASLDHKPPDFAAQDDDDDLHVWHWVFLDEVCNPSNPPFRMHAGAVNAARRAEGGALRDASRLNV